MCDCDSSEKANVAFKKGEGKEEKSQSGRLKGGNHGMEG